ncbi:MAG: hypothetical protein K8W52_25570 [Deltaproteobacteria bacterium]|nr:hypothetical protein [Deltaproteobacteria bacterium]
MRLPHGVTGFDAAPRRFAAEFKATCFAVARSLHGRLEAIANERTPERGYHLATLALRRGRVIVLCNAFHPLIAFRVDERSPFVDDPELAEVFASLGAFVAIPSAVLNGPPDAAALADLGEQELDQMRYWKPRTLGAIVFNHWD